MIKDKTFKLYNDVEIPCVGFGTWQVADGDEAYQSVIYALNAGYRHIDTALAYQNETSIGKAVKDYKINRKELFITSKVPSHIKTYQGTIDCFNKSLEMLDMTYLDLYLIHAPWPWQEIGKDCSEGNIEVWKAMIDLYKQGKVRAIGVSNFNQQEIENLINATNFKPMVNQIRYFIGNRQDAITNYCQDNDILIQAYSPLATGALLNDENLALMAKKYNKSVAQIAIRYCLQKNTLPLPKSVNEQRIKANIELDFIIDEKDMEYLDNLNHIGPVKPYRS